MRNQCFNRTIDDVLSVESNYSRLLDAKSGYWRVPLDKESGLLTAINTPWDMYR